MHKHAHITWVAALALTVSACGGTEEDTATPAPAATQTAAEATTDEPTTDEATASEAAPMETGDGDSATATESAPAPDAATTSEPAAAPEEAASGGTIPAAALEAPPEEVGDFVLFDDSGAALLYENEAGDFVTVDTQTLTSPYEDLVTEISTDNVEAGAGSCGLNSGGTSAVCYQNSEDGVLTMTGDAALLDQLVQFADEYVAVVSS